MKWKKLLRILFKIYCYLSATIVTVLIVTFLYCLIFCRGESKVVNFGEMFPGSGLGWYDLPEPGEPRDERFERATLALDSAVRDPVVITPEQIIEIFGPPDDSLPRPPIRGGDQIFTYFYEDGNGGNSLADFFFVSGSLYKVSYNAASTRKAPLADTFPFSGVPPDTQ